MIGIGIAIAGSVERSMDFMIAAIIGMAFAALAVGIGVYAHTTKAPLGTESKQIRDATDLISTTFGEGAKSPPAGGRPPFGTESAQEQESSVLKKASAQ